jgi:hypothetical protein
MHPTSHSSLGFRKGRHVGPNRRHPWQQGAKHDPAVCTQCHAVYSCGRWTWGTLEDARPVLCPACERVRNRDPVHVIRVVGLQGNAGASLLSTAERVEAAEIATHPLERLIVGQSPPTEVAMGTTGAHLARRLLAALLRTFKNQLEVARADEMETNFRWHPAIRR